ncbi:MAG: 3-oxoadipyl-CoA thiolase [Gammaproteobacteria bacterium]|jgi:3-oxoadipyl-CoA thiolase|nr:3-oxoadipyl-CoA thiolase [Gammaproteobacteria bacterium]MDH3820755.1 3-oxoadipyl-CoA thiolase [Gammaproteobacteria bacterium]MDH3983582.1 3-oxoadipyl-CoA thiolase [Gammaproteobacteria bacterium]
MTDVFLCDGIRTPVGRYGGGLAPVRTDDLAAIPIAALMERNAGVDWAAVDDVMLGCANQAGEDNRNVARMSTLLAGLPPEVPASTINRLCGSGLNAVGSCASAIRSGEGDLMIAGGVESMSRSPFVIGKAESAFGRTQNMYDTTMGWRFVNKKLDAQYGTDVMPQTAENLAAEHAISREDQDKFAFWSQQKAAAAMQDGRLAGEITPVTIPQRKGDAVVVDSDEHPRATSLEKLAQLRSLFPDGTVTAGNASGINDGAAALLLASEAGAKRHNLEPKARILGMAVAGVPPRIMGIGPVPATNKLLERLNLTLDDFDVLELNEAFSAQALACTRQLGLADDDPRINTRGGAIALGHPLGMSGARLAITAMDQLQVGGGRLALCTMCIGVGQGIAVVLESIR